MAALKDLAPEYRRAAAKLAMWLKEKEQSGDLTKEERVSVRQALDGIREVSRLLDGYYTTPRPYGISAVGWKGWVIDPDDDR